MLLKHSGGQQRRSRRRCYTLGPASFRRYLEGRQRTLAPQLFFGVLLGVITWLQHGWKMRCFYKTKRAISFFTCSIANLGISCWICCEDFHQVLPGGLSESSKNWWMAFFLLHQDVMTFEWLYDTKTSLLLTVLLRDALSDKEMAICRNQPMDRSKLHHKSQPRCPVV